MKPQASNPGWRQSEAMAGACFRYIPEHQGSGLSAIPFTLES